ncbi:hypothetical protein DY000_02059010 [Brassica cretica]|uniref:DUF1985 domain-containing protein n=1 Tax=Brassica cretica TaxID=69181 RepID=A0ABQ7B2H5_BRACR|nr:hypothetical protein DY000_02059010 [Brassica cretica]
MVSKSKKKVQIVQRNTRSPTDVAKQSPRRKSLRYPVSDSGDEGTGSSIHSTVPRPMSALVIGQLQEAESSSKLPPKLLAWGCYPTKLRLNIYSKAHVIGTIASCLQGSQDMETIMGSQFGRLFELHVARCHNFAKLINSFLCRQLLTVRKYELWFHFATHPLRFSLDEFQQVTGLNCGAFYDADSEAEDDPGSTMWCELFDTALGDITSTDNFLVDPLACENTVTILSVNDIVAVEEDPYLTIQFMPTPEAERYLWLDEATDERVTHLVELMLSGHHFQKSDFPGGDTSFSPIREEKKTREKDISTSEDREPEAPPQPVKCTHEDLKLWIEQQFKQLASAFQKRIGELGEICAAVAVVYLKVPSTRPAKGRQTTIIMDCPVS